MYVCMHLYKYLWFTLNLICSPPWAHILDNLDYKKCDCVLRLCCSSVTAVYSNIAGVFADQ